jgi:hypothetical protein
MRAGPIKKLQQYSLPATPRTEPRDDFTTPTRRSIPTATVIAFILALAGVALLGVSVASTTWIGVENVSTLKGGGGLAFHPLGVELEPVSGTHRRITYGEAQKSAKTMWIYKEGGEATQETYIDGLRNTYLVGQIAMTFGFVALGMALLAIGFSMSGRKPSPRELLVLVVTLPLLALAVVVLYPFAGIVSYVGLGEVGELRIDGGYICALGGVGLGMFSTFFLIAGNSKWKSRQRSRR